MSEDTTADEEIIKLAIMQDAIAEKQYELKQFISEERQQRQRAGVAIQETLLSMSIKSGREWLNSIYWGHPCLAQSIRDAHMGALGTAFYPSLMEAKVDCQACKAENIVLCKSWHEYKEKINKYVCSGCKEKEFSERERHYQAWEQKQKIKKDKISQSKNMPYKEYLLTEHWREIRESALKRAGYRCFLCSKGESLHVHHRTYENLGEESPDDVIVLCRDCHEKHHNIQKTT